MTERNSRHGRKDPGFSRDVAGLKTRLSSSTSEESCPTALSLQLQLVTGPERLPADDQSQETLRGKLRLLQSDITEVNAVFTELSARLVSISSEDRVILVTFKTFEEIWKFSTYHAHGFLARCLENLLLDQKFWLVTLETNVGVDVSIQDDSLQQLYGGLLLQEGSLFASCSAHQMFDSSTSGGDLYLEQGDVALFEPPFLGSGWSVLCLADGARGTAPRPALEPVIPFHQWFLRSCSENILVGDGRPARGFPLHFARGTCVATEEYDAEGPDELSMAPGDHIFIVGLLVSCFRWFTGLKEATGEVGLVRTDLVEPWSDTSESADILLDGEEGTFSSLQENRVIEETTVLLRKKSQDDTGQNYKLDVVRRPPPERDVPRTSQEPQLCRSTSSGEPFVGCSSRSDRDRSELRRTVQKVLEGVDLSPDAGGDEPEEETRQPAPPRFNVQTVVEGTGSPESVTALLSFLQGGRYRAEFGVLYGRRPDLLCSSTFCGHADEDELMAFLGVARETARKKRLFWPQTRLCLLLGKLCAGRSKFSQARVYLEEALVVPQEAFSDMRLLTSVYSNLADIYLLQKNTERFFAVAERLAALLMGTSCCLTYVQGASVLRYVLKKTLLSSNAAAEARACYLLAKHHWTRAEASQVVPYTERLLVLCAAAERTWTFSPSGGFMTLARLYGQVSLPRLSVSSARRASLHPSATLTVCLSSMTLVMDNVQRLSRAPESVCPPALVAQFLQKSLCFTKGRAGGRYGVLNHVLTLCLSRLFYQHGMVGRAIGHLHALLEDSPPSVAETNDVLIWLAWLHVVNDQPDAALDILDLVLAAMPEHCTAPQEGLVLNMRGVALRSAGDLQGAAESYQAAADICQENEDVSNWAVVEANLGLLCLRGGANEAAQRHLTEAVQLFSRLEQGGHEENFIGVLLELGQQHIRQQQLHDGKVCYEWALLLAIASDRPHCELAATRRLCELYTSQSPDPDRSLVYHQHQVELLRRTGDRGQEGDALETLSQLCLRLDTERAYRAALDSTKCSLGIFIDLGDRQKEAFAWLQAGKIYQLLGQPELVDVYVQVAQEVALSAGDTGFVLKILEAAGDIFFNSCRDRDKAIPFYRDRALPIALKRGCARTRLRLCHKLTGLMLSLKLHADAVEFARTVLDVSVSLGEQLSERVANHRLGFLYQRLQQHQLAEHHFLQSLTLCPAPLLFDEEASYYVGVYQTLGDIIFYDEKDPFDAAGYYQLALAAAVDVGNKRSQLLLCSRLANIYHNFLSDRRLSLFFYQTARALAAELNTRRTNVSAERTFVSLCGM